MDHLKEVLRQGISILIFPEGTQNRSKELLQPFYDGAFRIAIETQQPILPMVIHNAGKLMPPTEFVIRPGTIHMEVLPEISTTGLTTQDVAALKDKIVSLMKSKLEAR